MDRSFEGLLISVAIHALLIMWLVRFPAPALMTPKEETEITVLDEAPTKTKTVVTETEKKEVDLKDLKDTADYLAQFNKRVSKQMVAQRNGPTRNSQPTVIPLSPKDTFDTGRVKNEQTQRNPTPDQQGMGLPAIGGNQAMRQVAIGPSSIAEYIPGVEQGEFTALNTDQFTYYSFYARINEQVRNRWVEGIRNYMSQLNMQDRDLLAKMDRQTVVEIVLSKDGHFTQSILHRSSGDRQLDQTGIDAFRDASPFLNPPRDMAGADNLIRLRYGFMVRFRPPIGQAGS